MIGFTDIEQKMNIEWSKDSEEPSRDGKEKEKRKLTEKERGKVEREKREDTEGGG